jgi:hypothetical protein
VLPPIIGNANLVETSDAIAAPGPPHNYIGVARAVGEGVALLAKFNPRTSIPVCLLAAHQAECLLKAFLTRNGSDAAVRAPDIMHNLEKLWAAAASDGLGACVLPPPWLTRLSDLHNRPYHLRYSTGVHGIVAPPVAEMVAGLAALSEAVESGLRLSNGGI